MNSFNHPSVNIVTMGCSKNLVDSEYLLAHLKKNGFEIYHDHEDLTDVVIINTCGFIHDAKEESINTILEYASLKKSGLIKILLIMGCLSQRYRHELVQEIPEADAVFGVDEMSEIVGFLGKKFDEYLFPGRKITTGHYAYVKIAEGCNRHCSFCAIPLIRGPHVSRKPRSIIKEASWLIDLGVKELLLISQDLSYYGYDLQKKSMLAELLESLADLDDSIWIRLHYAYPAGFPTGILPLMRERGNICRYLDIPFQHISDPLLRSMKRGITNKQTYALIERLKKEVPGIALRTSIMVGYPGETEAMFNELIDFVRQVKFSRLGVFTYSHEEQTKAYELQDDIPKEIKQERMETLMKLQEEISFNKNQKLIGKRLKVLIDREEGGFLAGRTEYDSPEVDNEVFVRKPYEKQWMGNFRLVEIQEAEPYELFGKALS